MSIFEQEEGSVAAAGAASSMSGIEEGEHQLQGTSFGCAEHAGNATTRTSTPEQGGQAQDNLKNPSSAEHHVPSSDQTTSRSEQLANMFSKFRDNPLLMPPPSAGSPADPTSNGAPGPPGKLFLGGGSAEEASGPPLSSTTTGAPAVNKNGTGGAVALPAPATGGTTPLFGKFGTVVPAKRKFSADLAMRRGPPAHQAAPPTRGVHRPEDSDDEDSDDDSDEEDSDDEDSDLSDASEDELPTWVEWFLQAKDGKFFVAVDDHWMRDDFNLTDIDGLVKPVIAELAVTNSKSGRCRPKVADVYSNALDR